MAIIRCNKDGFVKEYISYSMDYFDKDCRALLMETSYVYSVSLTFGTLSIINFKS